MFVAWTESSSVVGNLQNLLIRSWRKFSMKKLLN